MTTLSEARAELVAAIVANDLPAGMAPGSAEPPCALVFGGGLDLGDRGHVMRGQVPARYRVTVLGGIFDDADLPGSELDAAVSIVAGTVRALDGWALEEVRADYVALTTGGRYLAADVIALTMIDL